LRASDAPANLVRLVTEKESRNEAAREHYMYRQTVTVEDFDRRGMRGGEYKEVRDVIFSPAGERTEEQVGKVANSLKFLKLTDQDFRDIREIQPLLITKENLFLYDTKFRGEEDIDGAPRWVVQISPRQVLDGQRLFDGMIWVDESDYSIVRIEGQAVPQIVSPKNENLFPHFTTLRAKVDGRYWFPAMTVSDDVLPFRSGPQRTRMTIRYENYKRFSADSSITYK
jgi:hypothetical protein